ncbi:MAG: TRAP transporter substrate-binding protein [Thiolinea sp.]
MRHPKLLAAVGGLLLSLSVSVQAASWNMPTPYPDTTFHTINDNEFAKAVAAKTNNALEIKIHSAGSLFKHPEISKAVRSGQVPIGEFFLSLLNNENAVFGADALPFLATNYDDAKKLWDAQKPIVTELFDKQGMMVLYSVAWPPQGLYSTKEIKTVDDLKGLKFRSYNATLEKFATAVGAAPTQVEAPDIAQAFTTGRVEAMITSPSTGVDSKAWDFLKYYTDIQAWIPKNVVVVNKREFQRLDKAVQDSILAAAAEAETRGWEMSKKENTDQVEVLKKNGINVITPSPELMDGLKKVGATMLEDWKKESAEAGAKLLEAYQK